MQWQDGVGNILIHAGEDPNSKHLATLRVGEVDWTWILGIVGFLALIVLSLCLLSKLRVSSFTRRAKRKSRKTKKVKIQLTETTKAETASAGGAATVNGPSSPNGDVEAGPEPWMEEKTRTLLSLIDSALMQDYSSASQQPPASADSNRRKHRRPPPSPPSAIGQPRAATSLDSIDGLDSYTFAEQQRHDSDVSLALSLVMDSQRTKPIFLSKFKTARGGLL